MTRKSRTCPTTREPNPAPPRAPKNALAPGEVLLVLAATVAPAPAPIAAQTHTSLAWLGWCNLRISCISEPGVLRVDIRNDRGSSPSHTSSPSVGLPAEHESQCCPFPTAYLSGW